MILTRYIALNRPPSGCTYLISLNEESAWQLGKPEPRTYPLRCQVLNVFLFRYKCLGTTIKTFVWSILSFECIKSWRSKGVSLKKQCDTSLISKMVIYQHSAAWLLSARTLNGTEALTLVLLREDAPTSAVYHCSSLDPSGRNCR